MKAASVHAQAPTDFQEAERRSLDLYLKGSWKELLEFGRSAVTSGHDYLNLRLRMGYAALSMRLICRRRPEPLRAWTGLC
jgi:hypothetical protein